MYLLGDAQWGGRHTGIVCDSESKSIAARMTRSRWSHTRGGFNRKLGYPPLGLAQAIRQPHHKEQAAASACSWTVRPRRPPAVSRRGR